MFSAARLQRGCREIESGARATNVPDEKKTLIAALKRCSTRKLGSCHRESPSARASAAQTFRHSKPQFSSNACARS
jgi:hypothetical protein